MSASPAFTHQSHDLTHLDPVWSRLRAEAEDVLRTEPQLASFIVATILNHTTLEGAVSHRVAARLGHPSLPQNSSPTPSMRRSRWIRTSGRPSAPISVR